MIRYGLRLCALLMLFCAVAVPAAAQSFRLEGISVSDSDYLTDQAVESVTSKYVKRAITFEDLQAMIAELNKLYLMSGVPTARAVLPPQEIHDGILKVSLVEAEVEEVVYEGMDHTSPAFLDRTLSLQVGEKPDFEQIEKDLLIYDIMHDVAPMLSFSSGATPGGTLAKVTAKEPKRFAFTLSGDNFGREETGTARATVFGRWSSVTGVRDILSFQLQASEGAASGSLGYSRPVGAGGGRIVGALSYSNSSIIGGDFETVQIISESISGSLSYRRPAWVRPDSHVMFEAGLTYETTSSTIEGVEFADIEIYDLFASGRYNRRFARSTLGFSVGLRAGQADALGTSETEGAFWLLYGDGTYARPVGKKLMFNGNLRYQYAAGVNLPVARLFTAGGIGSVRGYPNDIRGGDSGAILNLQISNLRPYRPEGLPNWSFTFFGFVDGAVVVPYREDGGLDSEQDLLASAGVGVTARYRENIDILAMIGVPLQETLGFYDQGKPTFYIGVDYSF
ncbi:ShlB/FhaC/HecB family hemolysin secretion/activation protein [Celeribacter sp. ULVN23_4]